MMDPVILERRHGRDGKLRDSGGVIDACAGSMNGEMVAVGITGGRAVVPGVELNGEAVLDAVIAEASAKRAHGRSSSSGVLDDEGHAVGAAVLCGADADVELGDEAVRERLRDAEPGRANLVQHTGSDDQFAGVGRGVADESETLGMSEVAIVEITRGKDPIDDVMSFPCATSGPGETNPGAAAVEWDKGAEDERKVEETDAVEVGGKLRAVIGDAGL